MISRIHGRGENVKGGIESTPNSTEKNVFVRAQDAKENTHHLSDSSDTGRHTCSQCHKTFHSPGYLQNHIAFAHSGVPLYVCEICGRSFVQNGALKKHFDNVHNGIRPFACDVCQKAFTSKACMKLRRASVHEGRKRHICAPCNIRFQTPSELHSHQDTLHRDLRPFARTQCERTFTVQSSLISHIAEVHGNLSIFLCSLQQRLYKETLSPGSRRGSAPRSTPIQLPLLLQVVRKCPFPQASYEWCSLPTHSF
uniref:C2H2-type domain-containing protein n=1 Tax=Mesocestoides corti TaxID=53468 RepID=A0A5K3FW52_MESCO